MGQTERTMQWAEGINVTENAERLLIPTTAKQWRKCCHVEEVNQCRLVASECEK